MVKSGNILEQDVLNQQGPFGAPDAARENARDVYIEVPGASPYLAGDSERRLQARVVIGKKGSGKTLYFRRLIETLPAINHKSHDQISGENWIVVREISQLQTQSVIDVSRIVKRHYSDFFAKNEIYIDPRSQVRDVWERCWEVAIIGAVYNLFFSASTPSKIRKKVESVIFANDLAEATEKIGKFGFQYAEVESPIEVIRGIISRANGSLRQLQKILDDRGWALTYRVLDAIAREMPPVALFIDSIDDAFERAPESWVDCQEGLFRCIFRILNRSDAFSGRVHVVVAVRDTVFSSLMHSEHASRFISDPRVLYIAWDQQTAKTFFQEKIARLGKSSVTREDVDADRLPFLRWLGFNQVENVKRNCVESSAEYILRHTRLLPRDIVIFGNSICKAMELRRNEGREFTPAKLRQVVHRVATAVTREAVVGCIKESLCSNEYLAEVIADLSSDFGGGSGARSRIDNEIVAEIESVLYQRVTRFFEEIGKEKFSYAELRSAIVKSKLADEREFNGGGRSAFFRFDNIFWRHGIIAYQAIEGRSYRWRFNWHGIPDTALLPESEILYGFHSGILDAYKSVRSVGNDPVF
jgi:hypothetical protein